MKLLLPLLLIACSGDDDGTTTDATDGPTDSDTGAPPTDTGTEPTGCAVDASVAPMPAGTHGVEAIATVEPAAAATLTCTLVDAAPHWVQVLPFQSTWQVLDDGSQAAADWASTTFDDGAWTSSEAPFGLHPFVTSPFAAPVLGQASLGRTTFSIDDPAAVTQLRLTAGRDDGLVVWLNGTEVARDNVPAGAWAPNLAASSSIELDPLASIAADLDPLLLVAGENTLAIALHQAPPEADAYFDANVAVRLDGAAPVEVHVVAAAEAATEHQIQAFGLLADSEYSCVVEAPCGASEPVNITTPSLAYDEPIFAPRPGNPAPASGAYTLINHARLCGGDKQNRLMVLDPLGRVRWSYDIAGLDQTSTIDIESTHLGGGRFLYGGGEQVAGRPAIVTLDHTMVHRASFPEAQTTPFHHDIEWHDGEVLGIFQSEVVDGPAVRDGFDLVQYDTTTQQVTWWWSTQGAYDAGETPPRQVRSSIHGTPTPSPRPPTAWGMGSTCRCSATTASCASTAPPTPSAGASPATATSPSSTPPARPSVRRPGSTACTAWVCSATASSSTTMARTRRRAPPWSSPSTPTPWRPPSTGGSPSPTGTIPTGATPTCSLPATCWC